LENSELVMKVIAPDGAPSNLLTANPGLEALAGAACNYF
jgi:hypothetical protein